MSYDVAIVGGGVIGAAAAYYLAKGGKKVCLIERDSSPSPRAASTDKVKVFRQAYPDDLYVQLAGESLPLWLDLEKESGEEIALPAGLLLASHSEDSLESRSYDALLRCGVAAERWSPDEASRHYPQLKLNDFAYAIYEPGARMLLSERATAAYLKLAGDAGVEIQEDTEVIGFETKGDLTEAVVTESGERIESEFVLITTGAWTRVLLPILAGLLKVTRQEVVYLKQPDKNFSPGTFPVFIDFDSGYYLLPAFDGNVKIANHVPTADAGQGLPMGTVSDSFIQNCREFLGRTIPALERAETTETRICFYNLTPDEDFIIDRHPEWANCWVATGFSGHGFKFAPLIGRSLTELITTGSSSVPTERFKLSRFWEQQS
ncbi:MAG TPA: N-methyl-L-tryptophan oxidase [Blastocatellia bacterium]|nr:N-methyl-L-tryptophan oxidase [Blastocatellia bacterium]